MNRKTNSKKKKKKRSKKFKNIRNKRKKIVTTWKFPESFNPIV